MADNNVLDQNEIERLLSGMGGGASPAPPPVAGPAPTPPPAAPAADAGILSQEELNALFGGTPSSPPPATPPPPPPAAVAPPPQAAAPPPPPSAAGGGAGAWNAPAAAFDTIVEDEEEGIPRGDLEYLAKKADESLRSIATMPMNLPTEVIEFQFPEFGGTVPSTEHATLDQISEVDLDVKVELGRTYMFIEDVLRLRRGSVVPLDKMAGETVDIYINGRLLAKGEVLVMNENFCVRIAELLAGAIPMQ
jgi:flagellar motor switch protein FliN/FliY